MFNTQSSSFLRRVLLADALTSFGTGLLLTLDAGFLAPLLGLPSALLRAAGLILLPFAALVAYVGTREPVSPHWVWAVILGNALWVIDSIALLLSGWITPTLAGMAFVATQALAVAVLAELEYVGLRKNVALAA
ncbi:hypothetical protein [Noviherbaspirillum sp.]|uniref:hypothetical protein n=1 Tax=Noviherbaspirillum sp. TaxID=1926288 RepID=UPI002B479520|nr:hypothetical protein [Noviherbaspirillum sp.]HJV80841.1 hypothetical protein [Noviherbaspirillum sp.]